MIIDFHAHAFPDALAPKALESLLAGNNGIFTPVTDVSIGGLIKYMDACGVDVSVLQPIVTKQSQLIKLNEWAASVDGGRIAAFGGIYPHTNDYKRDIDFVVSLGLRGLKFHAEYQNFVLDEPKMLKIYDYAFSRGLIILHHAGYDPSYPPPFKSSPRQFAAVADAMRGGVLIAAHLGGHAQWDDVERCLVGREIYLDTSMGFEFFPSETFLRIVKNHGADKILFGTDSPWSAADREIARLNALPLAESEKALIFGGNAEKLLGL
ncbi:MAG: amidohydrolase family protein [Oscillospiraceae bacterium]|jgi:predicted TIM-barrel fold metal-dependent hydrolase|nr:amidohydrolase family protein [Oscillospiraceae bacterium]